MRRFLPFLLVPLALAACTTPQFGLKRISEPMPSLAGLRVQQGPPVTPLLYEGKPTVINFWASWCTPCRREAPILQSTFERVKSQGVQFIGVDSRDNVGAGRAFIDEFGLTYPSVQDPSNKLAFEFGINAGLPGTVVVDENGIMRYRKVGELTQSELNQMLSGIGIRQGTGTGSPGAPAS